MQFEVVLTSKDTRQTEHASLPTKMGISIVGLDNGCETHPLSEIQSVSECEVRATEIRLPEDFVGGLIVTWSQSPAIHVFSQYTNPGVLVTDLVCRQTTL